jgi:hypothetical protein
VDRAGTAAAPGDACQFLERVQSASPTFLHRRNAHGSGRPSIGLASAQRHRRHFNAVPKRFQDTEPLHEPVVRSGGVPPAVEGGVSPPGVLHGSWSQYVSNFWKMFLPTESRGRPETDHRSRRRGSHRLGRGRHRVADPPCLAQRDVFPSGAKLDAPGQRRPRSAAGGMPNSLAGPATD